MPEVYQDEDAFYAADRRRASSDEVDLGATWREAGSEDAWHVAWLRATGELYRCRTGGYPGPCRDVTVLAVFADEHRLDARLTGWRAAREADDGLGWLAHRLDGTVAA